MIKTHVLHLLMVLMVKPNIVRKLNFKNLRGVNKGKITFIRPNVNIVVTEKRKRNINIVLLNFVRDIVKLI